MVTLSLQYPQIPFLFLGCIAVFIFLAARFFKISNVLMALLTALSFLLVFFYMIFESQLLQIVSHSFSGFQNNLTNLFSSTAFYKYEPGAILISLITLGLAFLVSIYCAEYLNLDHRQHAFYSLLILMICGLLGMLFSANLMILYLFCELMSICAYALVAFRRRTDTAIEAGFKYLMMGSVASIVILLGIALLFLANGSINITDIHGSTSWPAQIGVLMFFSGFCLKSALVPMHTWLPDAHGRAPSSISAILSGILVQSVFYVMLKITLSLGFDQVLLGTILICLSLLNIVVGNLMGLVQRHTKRLLGYSTIAQMGYIVLCMAVGVRNDLPFALQSGFFIIITHAVAKSLAFLSKGIFHYYVDASEIKHLERASNLPIFPSMAFGLSIVSLSALPPFPGFTGKFFALTSFFTSTDKITVLSAFIFLAGSLVAFGYYFPLLLILFSNQRKQKSAENERGSLKKISVWMSIPLGVLAISIIFISIAPQYLMGITMDAAQFLMGLMR
jgi:proton-translocating NADH-quinone oxidoreductase chain N